MEKLLLLPNPLGLPDRLLRASYQLQVIAKTVTTHDKLEKKIKWIMSAHS